MLDITGYYIQTVQKSNFSSLSSLSPPPNIHDINVAILHGAQLLARSDIRRRIFDVRHRSAPLDRVLSP